MCGCGREQRCDETVICRSDRAKSGNGMSPSGYERLDQSRYSDYTRSSISKDSLHVRWFGSKDSVTAFAMVVGTSLLPEHMVRGMR